MQYLLPQRAIVGGVSIIISVIGAGNGFLLSGSRVAFFLAREGMIPVPVRDCYMVMQHSACRNKEYGRGET